MVIITEHAASLVFEFILRTAIAYRIIASIIQAHRLIGIINIGRLCRPAPARSLSLTSHWPAPTHPTSPITFVYLHTSSVYRLSRIPAPRTLPHRFQQFHACVPFFDARIRVCVSSHFPGARSGDDEDDPLRLRILFQCSWCVRACSCVRALRTRPLNVCVCVSVCVVCAPPPDRISG